MSELVSIIIPTFNRSNVLLRAIHSVFKQTYKNYELIVVDDGSTDDTEIVLQPFISNNSLRYFKQNNSGVSSARNFGASVAKGKWFAFLDSDDEWLANKLLDQMNFLQNNSHLNIVYGDEIWVRNGQRVNQKSVHRKSGGWIFENCIQQCLIAPSSVIIHEKLFREMKGFDESYTVCEDYDLWLKISSSNEIGFISVPLIIKYGGHADQLSTKFFAMDMWRLKSLQNILLTADLSEKSRELVVLTMKQKGAILMQGYLKRGNEEALNVVKSILKELS